MVRVRSTLRRCVLTVAVGLIGLGCVETPPSDGGGGGDDEMKAFVGASTCQQCHPAHMKPGLKLATRERLKRLRLSVKAKTPCACPAMSLGSAKPTALLIWRRRRTLLGCSAKTVTDPVGSTPAIHPTNLCDRRSTTVQTSVGFAIPMHIIPRLTSGNSRLTPTRLSV